MLVDRNAVVIIPNKYIGIIITAVIVNIISRSTHDIRLARAPLESSSILSIVIEFFILPQIPLNIIS